MVELCGFAGGTILHSFDRNSSTLLAPPPQPVGSLRLPFHNVWPHSAVLGHGGIRVPQRVETFGVHLSRRLLLGHQIGRCWVVWLHHKGATPVSPASLACTAPPVGDSFGLTFRQLGACLAGLGPTGEIWDLLGAGTFGSQLTQRL